MTGIPITSDADGTHAHTPHTGSRTIDLIIAVSAIFISVVSLFVAIGHGKTEEKLVAASSWPFLTFSQERSGSGTTGENVITLRLQNVGVGPAVVKSIVAKYDGRIVVNHEALMRICCSYQSEGFARDAKAGFTSNSGGVGVVASKDIVKLLSWRQTPLNAAVFTALSDADQHLAFTACYCSVLEQCWITDLRSTSNPKPVRACKADSKSYRG